MDKFNLIRELVHYAAVYPGAGKGVDPITHFLDWVRENRAATVKEFNIPERDINGELADPKEMDFLNESSEVEISRLIVFMYRYAKSYIKIALDGMDIQSADEFAYVAALITRKGMGKSELIQLNIQEKTTGMEIIRRLLANNLIHQYDNPTDKRSKCVGLTDKGKQAFFQVLGKMYQVSVAVGGNLSEDEKKTLLQLLRKLDHYHHKVYTHSEQKEIMEAIQQPEQVPFQV